VRFGTTPLLSPTYLLLQLQSARFLGIVAGGMMIVILISQIDLSTPWTLTTRRMMAPASRPWAIPLSLAIGLAIGIVNGVGVAYLRVPSMISRSASTRDARLDGCSHRRLRPSRRATPFDAHAGCRALLRHPNALFVWLGVSLVIV